MREILTIIACLLVALLTAALAGPWFIDWTAQRDTIEAQLSQALGVQVKTQGAIDLKLLPTPRLVLAGVEVPGGQGGPLFRSGEARFELAVAPLMRGELNFIEASVEAPELRIDPAAGAGAAVAGPVRLPQDVRFERIRIHNGSITLMRPAGPVTLGGIDLEAEADSLAGPFKGSGTVVRSGEPVAFRFATGGQDARGLRIKLISDASQDLPRLDLDGQVQVPDAGFGQATFEGKAALSSVSPVEWKASGPLRIDAAGVASEGLDLRLGGEEGGLAFVLSGSVSAAVPRADLTLAARQLDLDRFAAAQGEGASRLSDLFTQLVEDPAVLRRLPLPIKLALQSPTLQAGGDALTDVALDLGLAPGQPMSIGLQAAGPGQAQVRLAGFLQTGADARYTGEVDASARDLPRLAEWMAGLAPHLGERLRTVPFRLVEVKGRATASAAGISASGLAMRLDRSRLSGALAYTLAVGDDRPRFFADLNAEALDLDGVPDLSGPGRAMADTDVQLAVNARAVRLARFGQGMIDAGRIRLRLQKTPDELRIEDLSVADLGGANISAQGDVRSDKARVDVRLDADRLGDLSALLRRVAPGPWTEALASRATALSPARLTFQFGAERPQAGADFQVTGLRIDGSLRETRVTGRATPEGGDVNLQLAAEGQDVALLLRQIGLETLPIAGSGRARITATGRGAPARGFDGTVSATLAGTEMTLSGHVGGNVVQPQIQGALKLRSDDAARLLRVLAVALPDVTQSLPVDLGARVGTTGPDLRLQELAGTMAGVPLSGELTLLRQGPPRLEGRLDAQSASVPGLVALLLGPSQPARPGARWSTGAFAPGLQDPLPMSIALRTQALQLTDRVTARDAAFTLRLAPGLLAMDDVRAKLDQGSLAGGLVVRRDGAAAALSGTLALTDVPVDRAGVSGRLSGSLAFSSTGANAAALAGGLAGTGKAQIAGYRFTEADPGAPARVIAQADEGSIFVSENDFLGALRRELQRGALDGGDQTFEASMAAGVLRLASAAGQTLSLDLRTLSLDARALLTADPLPKDWSGPAPQLTVIHRDGDRELDAGAFVNALAARAITREAARVEALEADIRERAAFARAKRGMDFLHQRQREVQAYEAEQARQAQEAARRAAEEAARKAEADRRQAEDERRKVAEDERRRLQQLSAPAPINIVPLPPPPPAPVFQAPPAQADPSAAGRY